MQVRGGAAGGARRGLMLRRSMLRIDCAVVLGPRSRRQTRCIRFAHCAQTVSTSQMSMRAARADLEPALLAATEIAPAGHRLPRCNGRGVRREKSHRFSKGASGQAAPAKRSSLPGRAFAAPSTAVRIGHQATPQRRGSPYLHRSTAHPSSQATTSRFSPVRATSSPARCSAGTSRRRGTCSRPSRPCRRRSSSGRRTRPWSTGGPRADR